MNREDVLAALKATTESNGGVPLTRGRFFRETGLTIEDLRRAGFPSHGELLRSVGHQPQPLQQAFSDDQLFEPLAQLTELKGHFPNHSERETERYRNKAFPSYEAFRRRTRTESLEHAVLMWCRSNGQYSKAAAILTALLAKEKKAIPTKAASALKGYVYLLSSGKRYKIGKESARGGRIAAASTWLIEQKWLHHIETDDPAGVEAYWHNRFKDKQIAREWYKLTADDVAAFRRWAKII